MSTSAACGMSGSISLGGEISKWDISLEEDTPDVTNMTGGGFKEYIPCLKSMSGTFDSVAVVGVIGAHAGVDFVNAKHTYSSDIIITDVSESDKVDGAVNWKYSFVSTGPVSIS